MSQIEKLIFLLVFHCFFFDKILSFSSTDQCLQETPCSCRYDDGIGINLTSLTTLKNSNFTTQIGSLTYIFHPCTDILFNDKNCTSSSVCVYNATDNVYTNLGSVKDVKFTFSDNKDHKLYYLNYVFNDITTQVQLSCDEDILEPHIVARTQPQPKFHSLILISSASCLRDLNPSKGLSTGSVLVILTLIISTVYLLGGALVLHSLRGARGKEMIPNFDFWCDLPYLVKDGVKFICDGCQVPNSNIYDQI